MGELKKEYAKKNVKSMTLGSLSLISIWSENVRTRSKYDI